MRLVIADLENYNRPMASGTIENLLERANASTEGDTSVNVSKRVFLNDAECLTFYETTKSKLVDIDKWNENSSATEYELFDEAGSAIKGRPITADLFIRIGLYGSGKYDWVRVISITNDDLEFIVKVKPSYDPTETPPDRGLTSHFFGPEAENNFCLQRNDKTVAFYVIGLNEKQNTKFTDSLIESARNAAVANIGYYSGLQKVVWKQFASNFLKTDEEKDS